MLRQLNEAEKKHGHAPADEAPHERADWTIDQGWERYTAEEHGVWTVSYTHLTLPTKA